MMTSVLVRLKHALGRQSPDLWGREGIQPLYTYCALRRGAGSEKYSGKKKKTKDLCFKTFCLHVSEFLQFIWG